jgi:hypothetical protein
MEVRCRLACVTSHACVHISRLERFLKVGLMAEFDSSLSE